MTDEDFHDLVKAVNVIYATMQTSYNSYRWTRQLDETRVILERLSKLRPATDAPPE